MTSRGIRNHNPGNIDRTGEKWQGMSPDQSGDSRFVVFLEPKWGIRALAKVLGNYQTKYGIRSVRGVIERWAPPVENHTTAYVQAVAKALNVDPDEALKLSQVSVMLPLVKAIIKHENGTQPYTDAQLREGLALAGVV